MEAITLKPNHPKQLQIMVGRCRVGYIGVGDRMPINFLPPNVTKIKLTEEEKIEVAKEVRQQMARRNADRESRSTELARLTSRDFNTPATTETEEEDENAAE